MKGCMDKQNTINCYGTTILENTQLNEQFKISESKQRTDQAFIISKYIVNND
jgi:hypothetical protein